MFPWLRRAVEKLTDADKDFLISEAGFIARNITESNLKRVWIVRFEKLLDKFSFLADDVESAYWELKEADFDREYPAGTIECIQKYFQQFMTRTQRAVKQQEEPKVTRRKRQPKVEVAQAIVGTTWYVLQHGRYGYVLGKLVEDYDKRYVVDVYKDGKLLKKGWSIDKENNRIVATINRAVKAAEQHELLESEVANWMANLLEEGRELRTQQQRRVFLATNYYYGTLPCVVASEDDKNYHFAVYRNGECINPDWELSKSNKRQIVQEVF